MAPLILGGRDAPTPVDGPGFDAGRALPIRLAGTTTLEDGGLVLRYQVATTPPAVHVASGIRLATGGG